jgi:Zn-dependent peptidase ImmA (M78 family)
VKSPSQFAADFRDNLGLTADQVVPEIIPLIEKAEYQYREEDFADDFAAFTEWLGSHLYLIAYNSRKQFGPAFKRFSLAHELGHIAMHADILHNRRKLVSSQGLGTKDPIELEANDFAAHFLMPAGIFSAKIATMEFAPASIRALAEYFQVSEIATAKHFVTHTNLACTMIVCDPQGMTKWENRSPKLTDLIIPARYVHKTRIPVESSTAEWIQGREVEQKVLAPLTDWIPDLPHKMESEEWVMKTPDGLFLTLLTPIEAELETEPE